MNKCTGQWFGKYMSMVANNVIDKEQNRRFDYNTLRHALNAITNDQLDRFPPKVLELYENILKNMPPIELDERQEKTLLLALLNCHMAYLIINKELL